MTRLLLLLAITVSLSACASTKHVADGGASQGTEEVTLDPMLIKQGPDGKALTIDVDDLFKRAYDNFQARRFEDAAQDYELVIRYFPDSRFYLPALYNAGLTYEKLERYQDAARNYALIIENFPEKEDTTDAYYRLAQMHEQMQNWEKVSDIMMEVLLRSNLSTFDRVEAHVRRSNALLNLKQYEEAVDGFRTAIKLNERAPSDERLDPASNFIVQSYFGMGRAHHEMVIAIPLVLPPERMGKDLQEKAELFMSAQGAYIRALSYHHPQWSMAAGYMIGRLYEDFYKDIFQSEIPDDLSEEAVALYFEELRKQIRPLMERAVQVYEKTMSLSARIMKPDESNRWVDVTEMQLDRMKSYLENPLTQKRAERFVRQGRQLEDLWNPMIVANDSIAMAREIAVSRARPAQSTGQSTEQTPAPADASAEESIEN
jgi:tetratricopeptide (TPR) repeat protein